MEPGIYILLLHAEPAELPVGSLGKISFRAGYYCYVGSALGPGGLARVSRHIRLAKNQDRRPRWHIDYLLIHSGFRLVEVYCAITRERLECSLAAAIGLQVIPGFGSSDCICAGHLFFSPEDPGEQIYNAYRSISHIPIRRTI